LLLARGADPNTRQPEDGQTALMWAAAQKHPEVAEVLLRHGADLNARSKGGFSPMMFAARVGDVESAKVLLAAGADVNERMPVPAIAKAPRDAYASSTAAGEEPPSAQEAKQPLGSMTPLLMAGASGHEPLAIFLLEQGADPNAVDENGAVALHYTVLKGIASMNGVSLANYVSYLFRPNLPELVKALLAHGADPNARLLKGVPVAGRNGGDAAGATPFVLAAAASDPLIMRQLAKHGADPLLMTEDNRTAIMAAAGLGRVQDFTPEEEKSALEAVQLAVELGGDVNALNEQKRTALHGATNLGANSIIEYLASKGARLDVRDIHQQTPLSIASGVHLPWTPKGEELGEVVRRETADLLLRLGATPLDTPGYFTPPDEETDVLRMNPRRTVRGTSVPEYGPQ
jgi:ankyrin repeat protein